MQRVLLIQRLGSHSWGRLLNRIRREAMSQEEFECGWQKESLRCDMCGFPHTTVDCEQLDCDDSVCEKCECFGCYD